MNRNSEQKSQNLLLGRTHPERKPLEQRMDAQSDQQNYRSDPTLRGEVNMDMVVVSFGVGNPLLCALSWIALMVGVYSGTLLFF